MKHPTEKHADVMRYFTPELFTRFNSPDENEADRANDEWEKALVEYRRYLKRIWKELPVEGRKLAELDLHDAELLNADKVIAPLIKSKFGKSTTPAISFAPALLALKQDDHLVTLIYVLSGRVSTHAPRGKWPFSKSRPRWLYEEVDLDSAHGGSFVHRVLISDGRVLEIPFSSVGIQRIPWSQVSPGKLSRTSA